MANKRIWDRVSEISIILSDGRPRDLIELARLSGCGRSTVRRVLVAGLGSIFRSLGPSSGEGPLWRATLYGLIGKVYVPTPLPEELWRRHAADDITNAMNAMVRCGAQTSTSTRADKLQNQCDGCLMHWPINECGHHVRPDGHVHMICTKERYK